MRYSLARQGVFATIQGEGPLMGLPMVFIRLAGCSVGCPLCDTDYRVAERADADEIVRRAAALTPRWAWITGGEPADYNLEPLVRGLHAEQFAVAIATSGTKSLGVAGLLSQHISVSPHQTPKELVLTSGDSLNLVPGLNGLRLADWEGFCASCFRERWVTPPWSHQGQRIEMVAECLDFIRRHPGWRLGIQAHKTWGVA